MSVTAVSTAPDPAAVQLSTVTVVLPAGTHPDLSAVNDRLRERSEHAATALDPVFPIISRWRTRRLLAVTDHRSRRCAGGPIRRINLLGVRTRAQQAAQSRWYAWQAAVAGTPRATVWPAFVARHAARPGRYRLAQARQDYLAQPRLLAMAAYNAHPRHRRLRLDLDDVDALQAGLPAYLTVHMLAAVPGDALLGLHGQWLVPASNRLCDRLAYLAEANQHLDRLRPGHLLVRVRLAD